MVGKRSAAASHPGDYRNNDVQQRTRVVGYRPARSSARCISSSWLFLGSSPGPGRRWT